MARILLSALLFFISAAVFGQAGNYRTLTSGPWHTASTWERDQNLDGTFEQSPSLVAPTATGTAGLIQIQNGHTVNIAANLSADQVTVQNGGILTLDATILLTLGGGALDEIAVAAGGTFNVNGTVEFGTIITRTIGVTGVLNNHGAFLNQGNNKLLFHSGSNYNHTFEDGGTIPRATWNPGSTLNITGYDDTFTTPPTFSPAQTYYNFVWNTPNLGDSFFVDLGGNPEGVEGNFQIEDTGAGALIYNMTPAANNDLSIGGDFIANGGAFAFVLGTGAPGSISLVNPTSDIIIGPAGTVTFAVDDDVNISCMGSFSIASGGTVDFSASSAATNFDLSGNYTDNGGVYINGADANVNFVGSSLQTFTSQTTPGGILNYTIANSAIVSIAATSFLGGAGTVLLQSGGELRVNSTNALGAIILGNTPGSNIRVPNGNRTYESGSKITYSNLSTPQFIGLGHPTGSGIACDINSSGVTLANNVTIGGDLTLVSGNLSLSTRLLTLNGDFIPNSNFLNMSVGSSISIGGSGPFGTLATTGSAIITNLTLNRDGLDLNLGGDLSINGVYTQTAGNLLLGSHAFRINGNFLPASPPGNITGSSGSSFLVAGAGTLPTSLSLLGTFNLLSMSRPATTLTAPSGFTVNNLSLLAGTVANSTSLAMASGGTILRTGSGNMTATPSGTGSYNVSYLIGSPTTAGPELPVSTTRINNVTINGGAALALAGALTVNGVLTIGTGGLNTGSNNVTLKGNFVSDGSGTFTGSTLICDGLTTISGSSIPVLGNLQVNASRTLTMPASIDIAGNITLNSTCTFNAGSGVVDLTGSGTQTITAAGKNFNNITVTKAGGGVNILPTLNLLGILDIQSATAVQSNGNLVLVSTSDGPTGNASIAALGSGASVTGNVVVQRRMSSEGRIFRDISSPVQGATVQQIMNSGITVTGFTPSSFPCAGCATNNPSMFFYNEATTGAITLGYMPMTAASNTLTTGRGYNVLVRAEVGTATMALTGPINSGTINYASIISFTSTPDPAADGWNFVGNPYPSTIDWDNGFTTKTNIQGNMISIWDAGANGYKTWNGSTGSLGSGMIAQGQGFWFQATAAPALVVTEASKVGSAGTFYRKETEPVHTAEIIVKGPGVEDRAYFQKTEGSSLEFDQKDGTKLAYDGFQISTLTSGERQRMVAINAVGEVPESGEIPLILENVINGEYHVSKTVLGDFAGTTISIRDAFTNNVVELADGTGYKFTITDNEETRDRYRFTLVFGDLAIEKAAILFPNPVIDKVTVRATSEFSPEGVVIDNTGKQLGSLQWSAEGNTGKIWHGNYDMASQAAGLYFVKVQGSAGVDIVKFIKK